MSKFGRIGAVVAACLIAGAAPYGTAQTSEKTAAMECEMPKAQTATSFGAQLYTIRDAIAQDFEGSLCRVAQIGYREVEITGLYGRDPTDVRALLTRYGLNAVASHADWRQLRDDPRQAVRDATALGAKYLVLAWLPPEERLSLTHWRWWVGQLNTVGEIAAEEGVALLYHAHDFEYQTMNGVKPIDLLQEKLDPRFVNFGMDIYWTVKGGGDPVELLRRFPGRFPLAHVKDMQIESAGMADVGDGRIDFASIFAAAGNRDFLHKFVERDEAAEPFVTLRRSLVHLKSIERKPTK